MARYDEQGPPQWRPRVTTTGAAIDHLAFVNRQQIDGGSAVRKSVDRRHLSTRKPMLVTSCFDPCSDGGGGADGC